MPIKRSSAFLSFNELSLPDIVTRLINKPELLQSMRDLDEIDFQEMDIEAINLEETLQKIHIPNMILETELMGTSADTLLDTGANCCAVNIETYKRIKALKPYARLYPVDVTATMANGQKVKAVGGFKTELKLKDGSEGG